jgi:hypothetical protein
VSTGVQFLICLVIGFGLVFCPLPFSKKRKDK